LQPEAEALHSGSKPLGERPKLLMGVRQG
jgi:hypothetical protein